jgi:hypothetical protein
MTTISHERAASPGEQPRWTELLRIREMWASLAIAAMWFSVAVAAVWGPDVVGTNGSGAQSTTIPSAIFVALFAFLATASLAKHALRADPR